VLVTELAHRLIYENELETADLLLHSLAHRPRIELTDNAGGALPGVSRKAPAELEPLWGVICPEEAAELLGTAVP
jgi:hypothetical protein